MTMASNKLGKDAMDTWDSHPGICPILALEVACSISYSFDKNAHKKWQAATYAIMGHPWISSPKAGIHGDIAYLGQVLVPFSNALNLGYRAHTAPVLK